MGGHGNFSDPRIGLVIDQTPDLVTPKLPALLAYQLSLRTPEPPRGSFDRQAAQSRHGSLFRNEAGCATCHQGPTFTDVLNGPSRAVPLLHDPAEVGTEPGYAARTRDGTVSDDAAAWAVAAPAVFPRRQRAGSARGRRALRPAVRICT